MRMMARAVSIASLLTLGAMAPAAYAQADADRATARALGQDGEAALASKDYKKAEDDFRRADSLVHAPTLMLGLARALAAEGKLVAAHEAYQRIIREGVAPGAPPVFARAVDSAKAEAPALEPRLAGMTISVHATGGGDVAGVKVTLDGEAVSSASIGVRRAVDPGQHVVHATADGYKPADAKITVAEGGSADAPLTLDKDLSAPPPAAATPVAPAGAATPVDLPPQQTPSKSLMPWPWVAFGVGAAGLGVGVITGVLAMGKHSDLASSCGGGSCPPAQQSELDSYHTLGLVSTIGFVVAGVGAATGVTLLLLQPSASSPPATGGLRVVPVIGPGSLGAVGQF